MGHVIGLLPLLILLGAIAREVVLACREWSEQRLCERIETMPPSDAGILAVSEPFGALLERLIHPPTNISPFPSWLKKPEAA
jgi:hypothetical protein